MFLSGSFDGTKRILIRLRRRLPRSSSAGDLRSPCEYSARGVVMRALILFSLLALAAATAAAAGGATLFEDSFNSCSKTADMAGAWDLSPGWKIASGGLAIAGCDRGVAVAFACPEVTAGDLRATLRAEACPRPGGWAAAGLMLYQGPDDYWRLALVEGPTGEHYCELVEQYAGAWQAQSAGRTALASEQTASAPWAFGQPYDLRITINAQSITGQVRAGETLIFSRTYHFRSQVAAVRSGRVALEVVAMDASFDDIIASGEASFPAPSRARPAIAAILSQAGGEEIARLASEALRKAGFETQSLDPLALADPAAFNRARFDMLVLPRSEFAPGPGMGNLLAFLRSGGHLLAFGGPPFEKLAWPWRGEWKTGPDILNDIRADKSILDFEGADLTQWTRASSNPGSRVQYRLVPGPEGRTALQAHIADLNGWETFASPALGNPFPSGESVTCFWAKGGPGTDHLVVEWNERDGSRWIAAVGLSQEWRHYALRPEDFKFWRDSPAKDRGSPGDAFNPRNAARIIFGLAQSHSPVPVGEHRYWVARVGAAPSPFTAAESEPPTLEAMSPWYKVYETNLEARAHLLCPDAEQRLFASFEPMAVSGRLISPVWRQRGLGAGAGQRGRWIPLLRAITREGQYRGAAASTYFATSGPYRGSTWTYIGLDPQAVRHHWAAFEPAVAGLAQHLAGGLLLANAGADQFSYFADAKAPDGAPAAPRLVARIMNIGLKAESAQIRFAVLGAAGQVVFDATSAIRVEPGRIIASSADCSPLPAGSYHVVCELLSQLGEPADRIAHEFSVIAAPANPRFIRLRGGDFYLGARKWYPHGLNFWPLYVAGLERTDYWLHWLSPSQYDPEPVERDLATLESLGANTVSIQYGNVDQAPALNDFLQRAKSHGIRVNVFIPGTHPLAFDPATVESLVRAARLADSDAMFAYDLAWEPTLGNEERRRQWDGAWREWIEERYGSIEAAERDWGFQLRRIEGKPTGPSDAQLLDDGPHRRMVAAYRRFADDLISQGYAKVTRFLRRLDPHHLFSARTGYGGTGQRGVAAVMPFDLVSGAAHLDFASAEGWGLWGKWENFERAGFTTLYGRWATNGKPVFWAEFGYTIYPGITPEKYEGQAEVYRNLYHMVLQSGANGSAGWWYPGGLRVDENSDFGVINPDGSPRLAAEELRGFARQVKAPRHRRAPDTWITIDRDADVAGYAGTWERHAAEYVAAVRAGKTVALRTEADGMDSARVPRVAVGGTPLSGSNPPKYLNAEFGQVLLLTGDEKPVEVVSGAVIEVAAGRPVTLRVEIINTGVATWLSPQPVGTTPQREVKAGSVWVYTTFGGPNELTERDPIDGDVPRYGREEYERTWGQGITSRTEVTIRLRAEGISFFGQRLRFTLAPR
jgi:hypothetical protein